MHMVQDLEFKLRSHVFDPAVGTLSPETIYLLAFGVY